MKSNEKDDISINSAPQYTESSLPKNSKWQQFKDSFKRVDTTNSNINLTDVEKANQLSNNNDLHRSLKSRQIQMIALGGSIGTGLLIGSGGALAKGGPASLLISYGLVGTMVFCVIHALGELCVAFPVAGAFSTYATRFVDSSWGFAVGWNYAIMWLIVLPLELVAAAMCIKYWNDKINPASWVAIFYVFIVAINLFGVKGYGEAEFYLTILKVIAIVGFIILGVVLVCGGGPNHEFIGSKNWKIPFTNGFKGLCVTFITASYSLAGSELVGLTSAETSNPHKTLPKAVRQIFWRLFLFYFLSLTFIGLLVPADSPELLGSSDTSASPFVLAIKAGGIYALPSIFNACILISILSVGNSAVYGCSRTIQSLGAQGLAPSIFAYVDRKGRPLVGLIISAIFGLLCFLSAYKDEETVFNWLLSVSGLATIFSWFNIGLCHVRFRLAMFKQGKSMDELIFKSVTGIYGTIYSMGLLLLVLGVQFWTALFPLGSNGKANATSFFQNYLGSVVILVFYLCHKIYTKNWRLYIKLKDIDLDSGRRDVDLELIKAELEQERELNKSRSVFIRVWKYWC
ncbi:unnamed protein product [Candida verbasci]|uniref:Amino acid permease/ SLC12A domain-containing protein n=1 Tax=Candida verbasci TaxID=1227364 RepID=A0A9W4TX07_9ASCO|nr:unnamed protein product [Candida verbasci]